MAATPMTSNCAWARDATSVAANDELGSAESDQLAEHFAGCWACAEFARCGADLAEITGLVLLRMMAGSPGFEPLRFRDALRSTR